MKKFLSVILCICMIALMPLSVAATSDERVEAQKSKSITVLTKDMKTGEITEEEFTYTPKNINERNLGDLIHYGWMPEGKSTQTMVNRNGGFQEVSPLAINNGGIIGTDDRVEVSNTEAYPYSAVCYMEVTFPNGGSYQGTAFMIGDNIAMTAAHCLYQNGEIADEVKVWPGKDGFSIFGNPFGTAERITFEFPHYTTGNFNKDDWAVIALDENIGNDTGWFGFTYHQPDIMTAQFTVSGYPGSDRYHQYTMSGSAVGVTDDTHHIAHLIDVTPGQSGAPLYRASSNIVYGVSSRWDNQVNYASQITEQCYNYLIQYIQDN